MTLFVSPAGWVVAALFVVLTSVFGVLGGVMVWWLRRLFR